MIPVTSQGATDEQVVIPKATRELLRPVFYGFSVAETAPSASTAEVMIRHGQSALSPLLAAPINCAADGFGWFFSPVPIPCPNGIYIDRVTGETTVVVYIDYA